MVYPMNIGFAKPNWLESSWFKRGYWGSAVEMFIGGVGGKFPYVHLDYYHLSAWINQLYGHKQFTVWPRGQEELLYDPQTSGGLLLALPMAEVDDALRRLRDVGCPAALVGEVLSPPPDAAAVDAPPLRIIA